MERDIPVDVPDEAWSQAAASARCAVKPMGRCSKQFRAFLGGINSENKDELIYRHPFAGPLDISDTLHFIVVHFDNHLRQIDKMKLRWRGTQFTPKLSYQILSILSINALNLPRPSLISADSMPE